MKNRLLKFLPVLLTLALAARSDARACAVCFGAADSPITKGMSLGILALLGVVGTLLFGIAAFAWSVAKRSRALSSQEASGLFQEEMTAP